MHPKTKQQISNSKTTEGGWIPPPGCVWYTGCKKFKEVDYQKRLRFKM